MAGAVAAVVSAAASSAVSSAVGGGLLGALAGGIVSFGISQIAGGLIGNRGQEQSPLSGRGFNAIQPRSQVVRSNNEPFNIIYGRTITSGPLALAELTDNVTERKRSDTNALIGGTKRDNAYLHMVIILASHECEEIETVYANDVALTLDADGYATNLNSDGDPLYETKNGPGTGYTLRIKKHLGSSTQAADTDLLNDLPDLWTTEHKLQGLTYIYVRLEYDEKAFPNGIPNFKAIVKGKKVYDPRDLSTAYSTNFALCVRDYLTDTTYGWKIPSTRIDDASIIAAANIADEAVTIDTTKNTDGDELTGSTVPRFTCNGSLRLDSSRLNNINDLLSSGAAVLTRTQGKFQVHAGAYDTPTVTADEDWLAGPISVQTKPPRDELYNTVTGQYVSEEYLWNSTDFPKVDNSTYKTEDNEVELSFDIKLPFVTNPQRAQRLAKILLEKQRQSIVCNMTCNQKAFQVGINDTLMVTNTLLGWSSKVFRVINWEFTTDLLINLTLQEESSSSYDWTSTEATLTDPAPNTTLPDLVLPSEISNLSISEEIIESDTTFGVRTKTTLTWSENESAFNKKHIIEYIAPGDSVYTGAANIPADDNKHVYFDLLPGSYTFRVRTESYRSIKSSGVTKAQEIIGLTAKPADITNFAINVVDNTAHLTWGKATDLDVLKGGNIKIKWSGETSGATWANSVDLALLPGIADSAAVALLQGTYLIKAIDSTGNQSETANTIITTIPNIQDLLTNFTKSEHPTWSGTKTNVVVTGSNQLALSASTNWDDITELWDDITQKWDYVGGVSSTGSYEISSEFDLEDVYTIRVTPILKVSSEDITDLWDSKTALWDDDSPIYADVDNLDFATAAMKIRTTDDDPSGSPTWTSWSTCTAGDYTGRAFEFKIDMSTSDNNINIFLEEWDINLDVPTRQEKFNDQVIAASGTTVTFAKPFFTKPQVTWAIQSPTSPDDVVNWTYTTNGSGYYTALVVDVYHLGSSDGGTIDLYVNGR